MTKQFVDVGPDVLRRVETLRATYYSEFEDVTIGVLFVHDDEEEGPVLKHQGYYATATIRVVGLRDRCAGMADAQIIIDKHTWEQLDGKQHSAVLDHELYHLERVVDKHGTNLYDTHDRPKLRLRKHDWQLGWFDEIARRHGKASIEAMQATRLMGVSGQLYFDFGSEARAA